ncbi:MAG: 23S rRNA (pseudouridine(1915)-N(3))-methyltransferase RlmH, partial [bacterium]
KQLDSVGLARLIERSKLKQPKLQFLIGGAFGVADELRERADQLISLSKLTLPHDLTLLLLLEQLFRAFSILAGS